MTSTTNNATGTLAARFQRLHEAMTGHVARGSMPGATYAVSHGRDVHGEAVGEQRLGGGAPMRRLERQRNEYVALISHDLRSPLSGTLMFVSGMKRSTEQMGLPVSLADRAERNVMRMKGDAR
jgi:signal transduction histidine kinase